jgi:hypothetical protein
MIVLGAALYRAGRYEAAIDRLTQFRQITDGSYDPECDVYFAMAQERLGHRAEALRWLDRVRNRQPSTNPALSEFEMQLRFLHREAEALILYDPIFPTDPFTR